MSTKAELKAEYKAKKRALMESATSSNKVVDTDIKKKVVSEKQKEAALKAREAKKLKVSSMTNIQKEERNKVIAAKAKATREKNKALKIK